MEKQSADRIITEYLSKIYGFSVKKSFSYDEAEDICSEIIQELYPSLLKSREIINIEGYVWRICEHVYSKYVSHKKRNEGISINGVEMPFYDDYFDDDNEEQILKLRREIAFLTERRRKIVFMFYYKNLSVSDISSEMGIPEGTVKWHLNKARNELKEGFSMERKIGKLGLEPVEAMSIGHGGYPGTNDGPETYLSDKLNLNIVYSVYHSPKTKEEIAEELGVTLVYIEDRIDYLEANGFLVRTTGKRFTTYVRFTTGTYSSELLDKKLEIQHEIAEELISSYVPAVRAAISAATEEVYIPGGNRELLEAAAIFRGIVNKCVLTVNKDLSPYYIKTTDGGNFIADVGLMSKSCSEPISTWDYWSCGEMIRASIKYPSVYSWSVDSRLCSRLGTWKNNLNSDYEYLYEFLCGMLVENAANEEKFQRLRERGFLCDDNKVNVMIVKGNSEEFFAKIPKLDESIKEKFADIALEYAMNEAKGYPEQMQDLIIASAIGSFIGNVVAIMVMDQLYSDGTFKPLSDREKITSDLIMFSDVLPE